MTGAFAKPKGVKAILHRYPDLKDKLPIGDFLRPGGPLLSYTQWEAWLALFHDKKLFIAIPAAGAPRDPEFAPSNQQRAAQQKHRTLLQELEFYGKEFTNKHDLAAEVLRSFMADLLFQSSREKKKEVPVLLPYLPNRNPQEVLMLKAMGTLLGEQDQGKLVVILHGNREESHDTFLPRFLTYHLPDRLHSASAFREFQLPWPKGIASGASFKPLFSEYLQQKLLQECPSACQGISDFFEQQPGPIILVTTIYTDDWGKQELSILDSLLAFWDDPDIAPHCHLIHWITIRYIDQAVPLAASTSPSTWNQRLKGLWLAHLFSNLRGNPRQKLIKRRKKTNQIIRSNLTALRTGEFSYVQAVVLPELQAVCHSDADHWAASMPVRTFLNEPQTVPLAKQVARVFSEWEQEWYRPDIPLDLLAEKLLETLRALAPVEQ
jgi:hypothetical protein